MKAIKSNTVTTLAMHLLSLFLVSCSTRLDFALTNAGTQKIQNANMHAHGRTIRQGTLIPGATKYFGVNGMPIPDSVDVSWNVKGRSTVRETMRVNKAKARRTNEIFFILDGESIREK